MDKNSVIGAGNLYFNTIDYVVFAALLMLSSLIGIYYGFLAKKKQDNTAEYLLGNKQITLLPISISLIASHISGINLLGFPTEIYAYGTQFWVASLTALAVPLSILYIFYPIFYDLQLLSTFMYFEKRYNRTVRLVGSAISLYGIMVFLPVVIYVPALALNQVSGVDVHVITPIICIVCVFYTTIGGLRAVVWTDTVQFFLTVGAALSVILLGILNLDDFTSIWTAADRGNRLIFFDLNPSPLVRSSFWTVVFGLTTTWVSAYGAAQSCIQKLLSVPNHKTAIRSIWIYFGGLVFFNIIALVTGLVMYANLEDCDPHSSGIVNKLDQVLPYFVMQVGNKIPGLPGLFISGIFSAALSTMSAYLNTMSCMIYDDFLRIRLQNSSEKTISTLLKLIVLGLGLIVMGLVLVIERLGSVFQMAISLSGVAAGTVLGLFTTGMLCRKINSTGVIWGAIASVIVVATITVGAQHASKNETLPMRTDGCIADSPTNSTLLSLIETARTIEMDEDAFWLFRVSFMYYSLIGCATVWIVSLPISLLTKSDEVVDEKLLAPFLRAKSNVIEVEESKKNILTNNLN